MTAQHPLIDLHKLAEADGRLSLTLIVKYDGKLVRLKSDKGRLWIMRGRENGSMLDRWAEGDGLRIVCLTEAEIALGPEAMLDLLIEKLETL